MTAFLPDALSFLLIILLVGVHQVVDVVCFFFVIGLARMMVLALASVASF